MTAIVFILLVEDEPLVREMMEVALEDAGFGIHAAEDGASAIAWLNQRADSIAALITDVRLGAGPSGWDVARHARHARPDLPVVYMTGDSGADWAAEGVPKSVLLQKPFAPAQAVTAIATLLNDGSSSLHG